MIDLQKMSISLKLINGGLNRVGKLENNPKINKREDVYLAQESSGYSIR